MAADEARRTLRLDSVASTAVRAAAKIDVSPPCIAERPAGWFNAALWAARPVLGQLHHRACCLATPDSSRVRQTLMACIVQPLEDLACNFREYFAAAHTMCSSKNKCLTAVIACLQAKLIIVYAHSGRTASLVAKYRPSMVRTNSRQVAAL